jgi:hypothetical protein
MINGLDDAVERAVIHFGEKGPRLSRLPRMAPYQGRQFGPSLTGAADQCKGAVRKALARTRIARDEQRTMDRPRRERQEHGPELATGPAVDAKFRAIAKRVLGSPPQKAVEKRTARGATRAVHSRLPTKGTVRPT